MAKLIGTMDDVLYGARQPQWIIEIGGEWYYGSSTVWYEVDGPRQRTMMESHLSNLVEQFKMRAVSGLMGQVKHYSIKEAIESYREYKQGQPNINVGDYMLAVSVMAFILLLFLL